MRKQELPMQAGEGERLHAQRRKRFWQILGGLLLIGFLTGVVAGFAMQHAEEGPAAFPEWAMPLGVVGVLLVAALVALGSWKFFVSVDEVEVADNLWGSLVGFYAYAILFPAWWAMWKLGAVAEPDDWAIFAVSMFTAIAVYFYRKWQSR